jgi:hypothetical protein
MSIRRKGIIIKTSAMNTPNLPVTRENDETHHSEFISWQARTSTLLPPPYMGIVPGKKTFLFKF